jgi:alkylhydroperoxidase family enzyme
LTKRLSAREHRISNEIRERGRNMPRLEGVPLGKAPASVAKAYERIFPGRDPVKEPGTATGTPGNWWTVFALAPHIFDHAVAQFAMFGMFSEKNVSKLNSRFRELAIMRAAFDAESQFVFSQHCKAARAAGVTDAEIEAIKHWQVCDIFGARERAVLAYADCMTLQRGRVADGIIEALKAFLEPAEIVELSYYIMSYNLNAAICRSLRLEYDDVPERIREVPIPAGGKLATDWAGSAWSKPST